MQVVKRSGVSPDFESELISFDLVEPEEFIIGGDVSLSIEVWEDSAWTDEMLASVQLSALRHDKNKNDGINIIGEGEILKQFLYSRDTR